MAARSLLHLYRNVDSSLLLKKDRGKPQESGILDENSKDYGALKAPTYVPGAELLEEPQDGDKDDDAEVEPKKTTKVKFNIPGDEKEDESDEDKEEGEEEEDEDMNNDGWETDSEEEEEEEELAPSAKKRKLNTSTGSDDEDLKQVGKGGWDSDDDVGWENVSHSEDEMDQDVQR